MGAYTQRAVTIPIACCHIVLVTWVCTIIFKTHLTRTLKSGYRTYNKIHALEWLFIARVQPQYNLEAFLTAYINKANCCFLLGANYSPSKGSFLWPDGNAVVYNSWNPGEPGFGLNCSLMTNRKGWGTERCDMERNYICMKKVRQLQDNIALFEYYNMWILISRQFTALSLY